MTEISIERVTYHAVRRYLELVCEVDVCELANGDGRPPPEHERETVERACAALGIGVDDVREAILSPTVKIALAMQPSEADVPIDGSKVRAKIIKGVIVTIKASRDRGGPLPPRRTRLLSKREARVRAAKERRRRRRHE